MCLLGGKCLSSNIVYSANVKTNDSNKQYIGLTDNSFKLRHANHKQSITNERYHCCTELSKHIWNLKRKGQGREYTIDWSVITRAPSYSNVSKRCDLCLAEKLCIIYADKSNLLNKRSELISKCRHQNRYVLINFHFGTHITLNGMFDL